MPCNFPLPAFQAAPGSPLKFGVELGASNLAIACGQCAGCRLERARQWAMRIMSEVPAWPFGSCHFLTLTYSDSFLPPKIEGADRHTLVPRDLQLFWKVLRKRSGQKVRYFACGEYGERSLRPHYHAIVFNLVLKDLCPVGGVHHVRVLDPLHPGDSSSLSRSPFLESCWKKGAVVVGSVAFESASYVARYVMKKALGKSKPSHEVFQSEFMRCSLKPAIGDYGFDRFYGDYYPSNTFARSDGHVSAPPKRWAGLLKDRDALLASELSAQKLANRRPLSAGQLSSREESLRSRSNPLRGTL